MRRITAGVIGVLVFITACVPPPTPPAPDLTPPMVTLTLLVAQVLHPSTQDGTVVTYEAAAVDDVDGVVPVECNLASGSVFAVGDTELVCTATDEVGNVGSDSVVVTVHPYFPPADDIVDLAAGDRHACAVLEDTTARCWGAGAEGKLGNGLDDVSTAPVEVSGLYGASAVTAGRAHSCATVATGAVRCWGANEHGQLGNGLLVDWWVPVDVIGVDSAVDVGALSAATCALLSDGQVSCWGENRNGELGDGTGVDSSTPTLVAGISDAVSIDSGTLHTCAVLSDNSVTCWGGNDDGQLGAGDTDERLSPVVVAGIDDAVQVAAGRAHTCVLHLDETVSCWGSSYRGVLGNAGADSTLTPTPVAGIDNVATLSGGLERNCVVLTTGAVWCWGSNLGGALGMYWNGYPWQDSSEVPVEILSLENVVSTAHGWQTTCAYSADGTAKCWGEGSAGELGVGYGADSSKPLSVVDVN